jgi:hypothetical protein
MKRQSLGLLAAAVIVAATLSSVTGASAAPPPTQQVRGSIVSLAATSITVKTASGPVTVQLGPKTKFVDASPGSIADVAPGKFLGIGSVPGTGFNRAQEVSVFADSMRGTGEGDYPWDPGTRPSHSTMTNGTVAAAKSHSMMTNATVGAISGSGSKDDHHELQRRFAHLGHSGRHARDAFSAGHESVAIRRQTGVHRRDENAGSERTVRRGGQARHGAPALM